MGLEVEQKTSVDCIAREIKQQSVLETHVTLMSQHQMLPDEFVSTAVFHPLDEDIVVTYGQQHLVLWQLMPDKTGTERKTFLSVSPCDTMFQFITSMCPSAGILERKSNQSHRECSGFPERRYPPVREYAGRTRSLGSSSGGRRKFGLHAARVPGSQRECMTVHLDPFSHVTRITGTH